MNKKRNHIANIYAQPQPGFASTLISSTEALISIRKAIDNALEKGESSCSLFTSDIQPFEMLIIKNDESIENLFWTKLDMPYTEFSTNQSETYGPTEYFGYRIRNSEDLEREITLTEDKIRTITELCKEQGQKYGFPKGSK